VIRGPAAIPEGSQAAAGGGPLPFIGSLAVPPPDHVLRAFGAATDPPELVDGARRSGWRCGNIVIRPVEDPAQASWLATTFEQLQVTGVRLARPVRSSDGRWVVAGWSAQRFVSGSPAPRIDDILAAAVALHEALAPVPEPRFLRDRTDLHSWADRLSWGDVDDEDGRTGSGHGGRLFAALAAGRRPVDTTSQVVHGELFGNVLFAGSAPPAVIDITPYWRPASWAAAVIAVDALSWGGASTDLLGEWNELPEWPQMLRRALLFRLAVSLSHPRTTPSAMVEILSAAEVVEPFLD